ncbi:putative methyltransferase NSUN7 [Discoglossus pictus]
MINLQNTLDTNSATHSDLYPADSLVRSSTCLTERVSYPDQVFIDAANIYQSIHVKKPPDRILVKYGGNLGVSVPDFKDERFQRWSYELAFNALKYQDLLETILLDSGFYHAQPLPDEMTSLVVVILYDFQDRKFQPRCISYEDDVIEEVREVENLLYSSKTKLAAALARSRIKHDAPTIEYILPETVRKQEQRASTLPLYAWINTAKTNLSEVFNTLKREGYTKVNSPSALEGFNYCLDEHCQDLLVFPPHLKDDLNNLDIFMDYKLVLQDKFHSLAVHSVKVLMNLDDDIIVANPCPGFTLAHMSVLSNQSSCNIFVCGMKSESREGELLELFKNMECKNIKLLKQSFTDIDPNDHKLQKAKIILLVPHCSGSGVSDPVEFILNELGDTGLLQDFSQGAVSADKLNDLAKHQLSELTHAMKFNKVQGIVYCTCSVYQEENENVINEALALQVAGNKVQQYRLDPPALPLCTSSEIMSASRKMFIVEPSETSNGCFLAILTRERDPSESVSVTDVLARAAAKGLLEGIEVQKPIKKEKEEKKKKGKAVAQKAAPTMSATQLKIAEFLNRENNLRQKERPSTAIDIKSSSSETLSTSVERPSTSKAAQSTSKKNTRHMSFQYQKASKQASVSTAPTLIKDTNSHSSMSKALTRQGNNKSKSDDKVILLKPVQIMLPPVMASYYSTSPAAKLRNPSSYLTQRWSTGGRNRSQTSFVPPLSIVGKSKESLPYTVVQRSKPWL